MTRLLAHALRRSRTLALSLALLVAPASLAHAQFFGYGGYGGYGYGYPGFGYGYPAFGYGYGGYGYPGFGGFGYGYGYPGMGYGYGYSPLAYGGYGGFGYGGFGNVGFGVPYGYWNSPYANPLFGLGLTVLGAQSALAEINLLGRGGGLYRGGSYVRGYNGTALPYGSYGYSAPPASNGTAPTYDTYGGTVPGPFRR
jgi:hypothetical protein